MTPIEYNGYTFHEVGTCIPDGIAIDMVEYHIISRLTEISEELAKEIHPALTETTHVPAATKYDKPVCTVETFPTHKEALIRCMEFAYNLKAEETVVLKRKDTDLEKELKKVIFIIGSEIGVKDTFVDRVSGLLTGEGSGQGIAHTANRYLSARTEIPILTYGGVGVMSGIAQDRLKIMLDITKYTKYLFVKAIVVVCDKVFANALPQTINDKPVKVIYTK